MTEASGLIAIDPVPATAAWVPSAGHYPTRSGVRGSKPTATSGPCATNEIGVITVQGPHVSPGYRNPEHNAGVFDGGVLNSGDLGYTESRAASTSPAAPRI